VWVATAVDGAFYERNEAHRVGAAPSDAIPGRLLPLYEIPLD